MKQPCTFQPRDSLRGAQLAFRSALPQRGRWCAVRGAVPALAVLGCLLAFAQTAGAQTSPREADGKQASTTEAQPPSPAGAPAAAPDISHSGFGLIGINVALSNVPVEADYTGAGTPLELFVDYDFSARWGLRGGVLSTSAASDLSTLQAQGAYVAYRLNLPLGEALRAHVAAGVVSLQAELTNDASKAVLAAGSFGALASAGAVYNFNGFAVGAQATLLYATADFSGLAINLGSNLLQLTVAYAF